MDKEKAQQKFKQRVSDLVGEEYSILGSYVKATEKVSLRHNCSDCGNHEWEITPERFYKKGKENCPVCFSKRNIMNTKTWKDKVKSLVGDEFTVTGKYVNAKTPIKMKHKVCGCENFISPHNFIYKGSRCSSCYGNTKKTTEQFKQEVYDLVGSEYEVLGEYTGSQKHIEMRHNKCGDKYEITPSGFLKGHRCIKCNPLKGVSQEEFNQRVYSQVGDEYTFLENYIGNNKKILVRHNTCGYEWSITPNNFLGAKSRCPQCGEFRGEKAISDYLNNHNIKYKVQYRDEKCKYKKALPFDNSIFDEDGNLKGLIEFDGQQHFMIVKNWGGKKGLIERLERDIIKTTYCEEHDIPLLRIKYTQFDIIEEILEDFLNNPEDYIYNHYYEMTEIEYYKEISKYKLERPSKKASLIFCTKNRYKTDFLRSCFS